MMAGQRERIAMTTELALLSRSETIDRIERLTLSADAKVLLARLADVTATVGGRVIAIGRRILSFVLATVNNFPNTAFGALVGYVMMLLIGSAAVLGTLLGPMLGPLLVAFGIGVGALADMQNGALRTAVERHFSDVIHG